jgi:hypothetical protein
VPGNGLRLAAPPIVDVAHAVIVAYELVARFDAPPLATPDAGTFCPSEINAASGQFTDTGAIRERVSQ